MFGADDYLLPLCHHQPINAMNRLIFLLIATLALFASCELSNKDGQAAGLAVGTWRGVLKPQNVEVPFLFSVGLVGDAYHIQLMNAEERIPLDDITISGDSVHIPMYIFDATIHAKIAGKTMQGLYVKNHVNGYEIPFEAQFGTARRFEQPHTSSAGPFTGKWEVDFIKKDSTISKAIGVFEPYGSGMKGTFLTTTGDYRYLEGVVHNNEMTLSCFDGSHTFLFRAAMQEDGSVRGDFWSGRTFHQPWRAVKNDGFELPDPYALTYIKEGYEQFDLAFPNTDGRLVRLADQQYKNKVVVVQILGTWCPNCMDETKFYVDWISKNPNKDVEFIGLAFESKADPDYAFGRIDKMKGKLGVPYAVLLAGDTESESREKALPMLNKLMSFPTSIILDRQHKVRKIHTGFAGPGTGAYYERFVEDFDLMIEKLLEE
jgi:thiol-disulfide isomerase/thioredoxin